MTNNKKIIDPIKRTQDVQRQTLTQNNTPPVEESHSDSVFDEAEYVVLPSKGYFYKNQYKNMPHLKIRKLNWEDENILTTRSYLENGTLFSELLKKTIVDDNGFSANQLVNADRDVILIWLRIGAFGTDYGVKTECSQCGFASSMNWNLGEIEEPEFNPLYEEQIEKEGCVTTTLPISGYEVKIVVPTMGKELEVSRKLNLQKEKKKISADQLITARLLTVISEITTGTGDKLTELGEIQSWLLKSRIPLGDSRHIQKIAKEIDIKVDIKQDYTCKECGHTKEGVSLPMTPYFFWPDYEEIQGIYAEKY
jgi:hypothetical protein